MNIVHIYTDPKSIPVDEKLRRQRQEAVRVNAECTFVRIPKGTTSGNSSVAIICDLPGNKHLFLEITMANFEAVAAIFRGAEQRQREGN